MHLFSLIPAYLPHSLLHLVLYPLPGQWKPLASKRLTSHVPSCLNQCHLSLLDMKKGTISSLRHHCLSICSWPSQAMSRAVCSSVVHRMLHVHGEDVPSLSTLTVPNIFPVFSERSYCRTCEDTDWLARWKLSNLVLLLTSSPFSHFQLKQMMSERKKEKTHRKDI